MAGTSGATGTDLTACGNNDAIDVWYYFVPPATGLYEFNTCGSVIDTTLAMFASCGGAEMACSDDDPALCGTGSKGARVTRTLNAGQTYFLRVAGTNNLMGRFRLAANRVPPPNDNCTGGSLTVLTAGVVSGGSLTAASASGIVDCAGGNTADVYFAFTPVETRAFQVDTCGSSFDLAVSVYTFCPGIGGDPNGGFLLACSTVGNGLCNGVTGIAVTPVLRGDDLRRARRRDRGRKCRVIPGAGDAGRSAQQHVRTGGVA